MESAQQRFWPDSQPLVERLGRDFFRQLPERPGVYLMHGATDIVLYVGKATSLRHRVGSYRVANPERMKRRTLRLLTLVHRIAWEECSDEPAAIRREAELLLQLKPRFNRAGVWRGNPRHLLWRFFGARLELAVGETATAGWQSFGPFGSGIVFLRAALIRLLWYVANTPSGSVEMPEGWVYGRLGKIAAIEAHLDTQQILTKLFEGDTEYFVSWINGGTQPLSHTYDLEIRDADLETVTGFMQASQRRVLPFTAPDAIVQPGPRLASLSLFPEEG
jgi:predicted GIY-YIG superfamily endonuclease